MHDQTPLNPPTGRPQRRWLRLVGGILAVLVLLAAAAVLLPSFRYAYGPDPAHTVTYEPRNPVPYFDRWGRARVVVANADDPTLREMHVSGAGHAFRVDPAAGFAPDERAALIAYLLNLAPGNADR